MMQNATALAPRAPWASTAVPVSPPGASHAVSADAISEELDFDRHTIRAVRSNGTLWFAVPDLVDALGWAKWTGDTARTDPLIPSYCRSSGRELFDCEIAGEPDDDVTLLSPVGVWLWTDLTNATRGQKVAAWAKKTTIDLVPDARRDDPATFLAMMPDGKLPPYPTRYSGRKAEWIELREAHRDMTWQQMRCAR